MNTAAQAETETQIRLLSKKAKITATANPAIPDHIPAVSESIAGKVITESVTKGT